MRLDTSLSQRMEHKMILAPRMIQSMEILQLAVMALQERIEHELEENPVLELRGADSEEEAPATVPGADEEPPVAVIEAEPDPAIETAQELVIDKEGDEQDFDRLVAMNEDWADHFNEEHRPSSNRVDDEVDKRHDAMVNMAARPQSLQDYLADQLAYLNITPEENALLKLLISHVDERGYVSTPLDEISRFTEPPIPLDRLENALVAWLPRPAGL